MSADLEAYKKWLAGRLSELAPVFAKAAIGNFDSQVEVPEQEDELTEFFVGVQIILDTIREKVGELETSLEQVKAASEIIATEKARVEAILDSIGEGLVIVDESQHVTFVNEFVTELFGEHSRILGQDVASVITLQDEKGANITSAHHPVAQAIKHGRRMSFNLAKGAPYYVRLPSGLVRRLSINISPILRGGKVGGAAVVLYDITEESNMDRTKSEIISIASHQLRTPLTAVRWYVKALMSDKALSAAQRQKYLQEIHDANHHMVTLVDSLLSVSRIDLGTLNAKPQAVDFMTALQEVIKELQPQIEARKLTVKVNSNPALKPLFIDPDALGIILQNLLSNAVRYSPDGKEISVLAQQRAKDAVIEVRDQGVGIPAAEQPKIFGKLFRASNAQRLAPDGSGLGLYITKAMVTQAGGEISFDSHEKHGTNFYVIIPSSIAKRSKGAA